MTPEQQSCLRSFLTSAHPYQNAQKLFSYVDSLIAAAVAAEREAINTAQAMRDAAVDAMQDYLLPDSRVSDDEFINRMIGIFDGPLQRRFDAAIRARKGA